jgi:DNA polymerase
VSRLRGKFHRYHYGEATDAPLQIMVTFHPRFLLECGDLKKAAWLDLQMIQRQLQAR